MQESEPMTTFSFELRQPRAALGALALAGLLAASSVSRTARADDVSGAANAFSRAQKAELSGDYADAAELYELADSLAPAPEALRSALRARVSAGQLELAAVHAEELQQRYASDPKSMDLAKSTLDEAAKKLMRFEIDCKPTACTILVDGAAADPDAKQTHIVYLAPGKHDVAAGFGKARTESQPAEGAAGYRGTLSFDAPPEPPPSVDLAATGSALGSVEGDQGVGRKQGLSPWIFAGGAVATVGLGAVTLWSGLDVLSAHNAYQKNETTQGYNDGKSKETRTNVLIGATAVVSVATGVIALFTDWSGKHDATAAESPGIHATASVTRNSAGFIVGGVY
jgi:hypothetical protein